jgi:ATP-dependent DNA ligase
VVVGFVPALAGSLRAIYLGRHEDKALLYAGKAGTGFTGDTARALREKLDAIAVRKSPLTVEVKKPKATWVKPQVLADIEYRAIHGGWPNAARVVQGDEGGSSHCQGKAPPRRALGAPARLT